MTRTEAIEFVIAKLENEVPGLKEMAKLYQDSLDKHITEINLWKLRLNE